MKAFLIFAAVLVGIVLVGWVVSKLTGSHAWFLDDWKFDEGEKVFWRDEAADVFVIPTHGQAVVNSVLRLHRNTVVVTDRRILVATEPLYGKKRMVQYVLWPAPPADGNANKLDGGLLTVGYQTMVYVPGKLEAHLDSKKPYVAIAPAPGIASSTNVSSIQIYSDQLASFPIAELQKEHHE